jgi:hypothetical protein
MINQIALKKSETSNLGLRNSGYSDCHSYEGKNFFHSREVGNPENLCTSDKNRYND